VGVKSNSQALGGQIEHDGHDGRVPVAVDDEAHLDELVKSNSQALGGQIEHDGHDGRVPVAVDDEAHLDELVAEVDGVVLEALDAVAAVAARVLAGDDGERAPHLLAHRRTHAGRVAVAVRALAQVRDYGARRGHVAARRAERLGECALK